MAIAEERRNALIYDYTNGLGQKELRKKHKVSHKQVRDAVRTTNDPESTIGARQEAMGFMTGKDKLFTTILQHIKKGGPDVDDPEHPAHLKFIDFFNHWHPEFFFMMSEDETEQNTKVIRENMRRAIFEEIAHKLHKHVEPGN